MVPLVVRLVVLFAASAETMYTFVPFLPSQLRETILISQFTEADTLWGVHGSGKNGLKCYLCFLQFFFPSIPEHTHIDDRAGAGQTGADAILCSHHNSVFFSTV